MKEIVNAIKQKNPIYIQPYKEAKAWGCDGTGEYWYGAEEGEKSSLARVDGHTASMAALVSALPGEILGEEVVSRYGRFLPLVKLLTPKGRLSAQFHDAKNELWVVTGINREISGDPPELIIGFDPGKIGKFGTGIRSRYKEALKEFGNILNSVIDEMEAKGHKDLLDKYLDVIPAAEEAGAKDPDIHELLERLRIAASNIDSFYNHVRVKTGDVIPVPRGTLHALGAGIEVVEPQIPGPTQSLEDGTTYPVRYYFPDHPRNGAEKMLDIDRIDEMDTGVWDRGKADIIESDGSVKIERLPGGFEDKGMAVHRISMDKGDELEYDRTASYHTLVAVEGKAAVDIGGRIFNIPEAAAGGEILLVPSCCKTFKIKCLERTQIIDTFTPAGEGK